MIEDLEKRSSEKKDQKRRESVDSAEIGEIHSVNSIDRSKWYQRVVDSYKQPLDVHDYDDLEPHMRARLFLERTKPKLSRRHLIMVALSSCVGTGLFVGSKTSLEVAGPASVLIGFGVMGINLLCIMACCGELSLRYPTVNIFYEIPARFLHPSIGFAIGLIYALGFLVSAPIELIACTEFIEYWDTDNNSAARVNPIAWVSLLWACNVFIQLGGSRFYGEVEFFAGVVKLLGVTGYILFCIINVCGGPPTNHYIGAHNFHNPSAFLHSFKGVVQVLVSCSFAYGGTELSAIAAAETANPLESIPSSVRQTFWRIMYFFILGVFMFCLMVPPTSDELVNPTSGSGSPWLLAIKLTGVKALPSIMNAVLLISIFGVSNDTMYAASRALTSLALHGANFKWFCYIDRQGRPIVSIAVVVTFALISLCVASDKSTDVFNWMYAFAALGFLYAWSAVCMCYLRVRWVTRKRKGNLDDFVYKSPLGDFGAIFSIFVCIATLGLQFWVYIWPIGSKPNAQTFFENDLSVPFFIFLIVAHKLWKRGDACFVKDSELDLDSDVRDMDIDEANEKIRQNKEEARHNVLKFLSVYLC